MLFDTPALDGLEEAVVGRIDEVRKTLSYATAAKRWTGALARMTLARGIRGSNSIEGFHVTIEDAMAAGADEAPMDAAGETLGALVGYRNAMTYALQLSDDPHFSCTRAASSRACTS